MSCPGDRLTDVSTSREVRRSGHPAGRTHAGGVVVRTAVGRTCVRRAWPTLPGGLPSRRGGRIRGNGEVSGTRRHRILAGPTSRPATSESNGARHEAPEPQTRLDRRRGRLRRGRCRWRVGARGDLLVVFDDLLPQSGDESDPARRRFEWFMSFWLHQAGLDTARRCPRRDRRHGRDRREGRDGRYGSGRRTAGATGAKGATGASGARRQGATGAAGATPARRGLPGCGVLHRPTGATGAPALPAQPAPPVRGSVPHGSDGATGATGRGATGAQVALRWAQLGATRGRYGVARVPGATGARVPPAPTVRSGAPGCIIRARSLETSIDD